ncbi:MAG: hypothetical protein P8P29_03050, partial [Flavobacteriaceae bacterium]|nr:hypothetical protein [Flavobacteriaceae bacterium]
MTAYEKLQAAYDAAEVAFEAVIDAAYKHTQRSDPRCDAAVNTAWAAYTSARKAARIAYKTEL